MHSIIRDNACCVVAYFAHSSSDFSFDLMYSFIYSFLSSSFRGAHYWPFPLFLRPSKWSQSESRSGYARVAKETET
jgi:hypothetical protein